MDSNPTPPLAAQSDVHGGYDVSLHDRPVPLPAARGPVSAALIALLLHNPWEIGRWEAEARPELRWQGPVESAILDDDLQLALWLSYELHYRGLAEVSEDWEWHPELLRARQEWEHLLCTSLAGAIGAPHSMVEPDPASVIARLNSIAATDDGPSLSGVLMREADSEQFREFLIHRSIYHLKEADPHSWAIPRMSGSVKSALVTIQSDEYGSGRTAAMHAELFRTLMRSWGLETGYGHYLDLVPAVTLLSSNIISMFGLNRRWRGALVGHLALFEMTSSIPNGRYGRGHRRLGGDEAAARFFDEHVVADAMHEQIAAHDLAGGLAAAEPDLAGDIVFGARCAQLADQQFARHLINSWSDHQSSLRSAGRW
ncbi:MAG: hypothetical protein QOF52_2046 [Propionibacteriaceae bacterium]|jgi:hypothetical protein|nr:hypothetical protein [Propionibacteriaceae bacterium]MDX6322188.1 hypothetical protein [Propionibacteriaceae bacterium]